MTLDLKSLTKQSSENLFLAQSIYTNLQRRNFPPHISVDQAPDLLRATSLTLRAARAFDEIVSSPMIQNGLGPLTLRIFNEEAESISNKIKFLEETLEPQIENAFDSL